MKLNKIKQVDLLIVVLIPILVAIFAILLKLNFLITTVLIFGIPALYVSIRCKKFIIKNILFSLLFSIPLAFIFDYLIVKDKGWYIVDSIFTFRLFDIVAIEQFIWGFVCIFYIVMFYKYFFDAKEHKSIFSLFKKKNNFISKRMEYLSIFLLSLLFFSVLLVIFQEELFVLHYAYLILSIVFIVIPLSIFFFKFPNLLIRFTLSGLYFLFLAVVVEYTGLKLAHWTFPGDHFLGTINFVGFTIPYEEVVMYFILSAPAVLAYYEFFDDDRR